MKYDDKLIEASIGENFFAPKCIDRKENFDIRNAHAIANIKCNFKCSFCKNGLNKNLKPDYMTLEEFSNKIDKLLYKGKMFKFTGGEPCMNPNLNIMLEVVKQKGGIIFLDTNGSINTIVSKLLNQKLINVLGVSIKGLTKEEAIRTSGIKNEKLCWDNPINLIKEASEKENVRVIVTYVTYDNFEYKDLEKFAQLLDGFGKNIYLKINNLCGDKHRDVNIKAIEPSKLENMLKRFTKENEKWRKKTILINSSEGVTDYSKIMFN
ncbi:MAG: radical SAM protein [Clostridia bacterium]|nr:radical SAM protein [Clostridia bacterium]